MLSILKTLSLFFGSRGPDGPDLPLPCGRKFHIENFTSHLALPWAYIKIVTEHFWWGLKWERTKHQIFPITQKTGRSAFSNIKLSKKLRLFSVAKAHGLIYPRLSDENFNFACTPCLMMGEVSLETSPKNIMIQGMINSKNSMNTTESTNTNIFKIFLPLSHTPILLCHN